MSYICLVRCANMKIYLAKASWGFVNITREFVTTGETEDEAKGRVVYFLGDSIWNDSFELTLIEVSLPFEIF